MKLHCLRGGAQPSLPAHIGIKCNRYVSPSLIRSQLYLWNALVCLHWESQNKLSQMCDPVLAVPVWGPHETVVF